MPEMMVSFVSSSTVTVERGVLHGELAQGRAELLILLLRDGGVILSSMTAGGT